MAMRPTASLQWGGPIFWLAVTAAAVWFLADEVGGILRDYTRPDFVLSLRQGSASVHFLVALPILLFGPLQFSGALRRRWPRVHRWLGTIFLASSVLAATLALYLGWTISLPGSRVPLVIFALLWLFFSLAAWQTARRRDFVAHQRFVVRSIALALAFVWVRLLGVYEDELLGFMPIKPLRETTSEWLSFVLPLLAVEMWFTWWPAARRSFRLRD